MKKILLLLFVIPSFIFSQSEADKAKLQRQTNLEVLSKLSLKYALFFKNNKIKAREFAKINNWELTIREANSFSELVGITVDNKPIYYSTFNDGAAVTARANKLYTGGGLGLSIQGQNMLSGVWDAGSSLLTHELFEGRNQNADNSPSTHYHSTHVAGTINGSGAFQNGNARGMAFMANVNSYDWNNDLSEVATAAAAGLLLSNHSYGRNPNTVAAADWGKYDLNSQGYDEIMFNAPYYQFVCAAGNSRGNFNTIKNGYDTMTGHALSKNGITVAAVNELLNYTGANSVVMSNFSSWGPTDDGRIKPDISAKGVDTYSAMDTGNSSYSNLSGTSMAAPSVNGTLLLLQQYYNQRYGSFMKASTLRGLMIHTADEAGANPGPDYSFGWGLINAEKGADVITKKGLQTQMYENALPQNGSYVVDVEALGTEPLVATLCWTDPKGAILSQTIDDSTPKLINDLDIRIVKTTTTSFPWKLNVANTAAAATTGDNIVDNVEKIEINNPTGNYSVNVTHKGNLLNSAQNYSLIISGITEKDFWITTAENTKNICNTVNSTSFAFVLNTKVNFNDVVAFSTLNLPAGLSATFSPLSMNAGGNFILVLDNISALAEGSYPILVKGDSGNDQFETTIFLNVFASTLSPVTLSQPQNNEISINNPVVFNWNLDVNAQDYTIQISNNSSFTTIQESATVANNSFTSNSLNNNTTYFWRVKNNNQCGVGSFSAPFSFTTVCNPPTQLAIIGAGSTSMTIGWLENSGSNSWQYEVVLQGANPTGIGVISTTNPTIITGLNTNTCYKIYVKSNCSPGFSSWSTPFNFCTQPNYCNGDHFYDTGGASGNYQNSENYTKTIYPETAGDRVKAVFNSFSTEGGYDYLIIYNGPNTTSPILFNGSGSTSPGTKSSTHPSGALTFRFYTDSSVTSSGWDATIICETLPACPTPPNEVVVSTIANTSATFNWIDNSNSTTWEVELVVQGATPTGSGIITNSKPVTINTLVQNTCYKVYVRSICIGGTSEWSLPVNFCTTANYCAGDHFYDTGGASGNYQINENRTTVISPSLSGQRVRAIFNTFQIQSCCDYMTIYNGPNTNFPVLFSGNGVSPGSITSTHASGSLTFVFNSGGQTPLSGWDATIICEAIPPCSYPPTNLNLVSSTTNSAVIGFTENSSSTSWEYEVVSLNGIPTGIGIQSNSNPIILNNLLNNMCYKFYVRSNCNGGSSEWIGPFNFCTQPNYCAGNHFYDTGGATGNYQNGENYVKTIFPENTGDRVKAIFNSFSTEGGYDYLIIYNGPNTTSPVLFNGSGSTSPGTKYSTHPSGALTFRFYTDSSVTGSGWDATIICEAIPACPNPPTNIALVSAISPNATLSWTDNSAVANWEVQKVLQGATPLLNGIVTTSNPYTFNGLTSNVCYDFYVRSICPTGTSDWTGPFTFCVIPDYCNGEHFYDTGGASGNYQTNENKVTTIYPDTNGERVRAVFNTFDIQECCDTFYVINGPTTNYPILYNSNSSTVDPTTLVSTSTTGALTFVFYSSGQTPLSGWDATISCEPLPACLNTPLDITVQTVTKNSATVGWYESFTSTSWKYEVVPQGTQPTGIGLTTNTNPKIITGLSPNTCYDFYVKALCATGSSDWAGPFSFCTTPDFCSGAHFYDTGGASGNYQNNESKVTTIYPDANGDRVKAVFNSFEIQNCCDTFYVINGPTTNYPLLYNSNSSSIDPTTLVSTDTSGALTFVFYSGGQTPLGGWDATIICEPLAGCLNTPSNIILQASTKNTATIGWYENQNSTSWNYEVVAQGALPTGAGLNTTTNPKIITELSPNTCYDFYVQAICANGTSDWAGPFTFCTIPDYCAGDHFYDTGGANGNYQTYENYVTTIYPDANGERVRAVFNSFAIQNCCDVLYIYNGPNTSSPLLYISQNSPSPGTKISTDISGALTFVFYSGGQTPLSGWDATISCLPVTPCSITPSQVSAANVATTTALINWTENANATSWEYQVVEVGTAPGGNGTVIATNLLNLTNLTPNTCYNFYVRSVCNNIVSDWTDITFCTVPDYCAGNHFYDTGGATGNYQNSENYITTIYPTNPTAKVSALFNTFQLQSCCDRLKIYNGPNINSTLMFNSGSVSPGTKTSTHTSGALTFQFYSDGGITGSGWDATISCGSLSDNDFEKEVSILEYYPNPVTNILKLKSSSNIKNYIVCDALGREINSAKVNLEKFEIDMSKFASGNYFIKLLDSNDVTKTIKIMKN